MNKGNSSLPLFNSHNSIQKILVRNRVKHMNFLSKRTTHFKCFLNNFKYTYTVDSFILVGTNVRGLRKTNIFVEHLNSFRSE